jgi:transposase-like protein
MEEKLRFVFEYEMGERSMTELCQRYAIARETGYVWLRRYRAAGVAGLVERSRSTNRHANQTPEEIEQRSWNSGRRTCAGARGSSSASWSGRAGARLAGGQHDRSAAEAGRFGGGPQEALAHRAVHRAVGACR